MLYPSVFPNLKALTAARADLVAILLTGLPSGVVAGFQNYTGKTPADMLRLNVAVPPAKTPNPLGLVAGDPAGFPNGRRVFDDVTTIELRAIAGLTYPLIDKSFKPDAATSAIEQGVKPADGRYLTRSRTSAPPTTASTRRRPSPLLRPRGPNRNGIVFEPIGSRGRTSGNEPPFRGHERSFRMNTVSRRSFLKTAGLATGAAAIAASPSVAAAVQPNALETTPSGPLPHEPIVAVIRNADLGEVTVLSGRTEKTYRDKVLVRRLLKAAEQNHTTKKQGVA